MSFILLKYFLEKDKITRNNVKRNTYHLYNGFEMKPGRQAFNKPKILTYITFCNWISFDIDLSQHAITCLDCHFYARSLTKLVTAD